MSDLQGEIYRSREDMLKILNMTTLEEVSSVMSSALICSFIVIPREERMYFSDRMCDIMGSSASQDVLLLSFLQYVPENEREGVARKYQNAFKDLVLANVEHIYINHSIRKSSVGIIEVETHLQALKVDRETFVVGVMIDKTRSRMDKIAKQLFAEGINEYIFSYDSLSDTCYVNRKFVTDFGLRSDTIPNASREVLRYLSPEDVDRFTDGIRDFIKNKTPFEGDFVFLSAGRGEIHLRSNGLSDKGQDGPDPQYISGCFSDITGFVEDESIRTNLIEGSSAITFYADYRMGKIVFSENIHEILPDIETEHNGDFIEIVAGKIVPEDRKRFRDIMHQIIDGKQEKFSVEFRVMDNDERVIWIACRGKSFFDTSRQSLMLVGTIFDLTRMNEVREDVERNASCHELTGFPTRERLLSDAEVVFRNKDLLSAAVVLVDINGFHSFNDRYGRSAGNEILIAVGNMLQEHLPEGASIYHIGVDIFCILWPHASRIKVTEYMSYLQEESIQPLEMGRGSFFITYGLSAAIYPSCGSVVDELLVNAEIALHKVKQDKKLKYAIYSPVDKRELKERLDFELQITQSIRNNMESFQLYYQPLINAKTEQLDGAEALLRWIAPNGELVNPERVVNALESTDQMETIGAWILDKAIGQCARWIQSGADPNFYVHINVTADDLVRRDFASDVMSVLARYNLSPKNILLEITETSLMRNIAMCRQNLIRLRNENVRIALDDFGTGYSSFNYLRELPVDEIKIDKAFVDDMDTIAFNRSFISAITMLAHSIKKHVCVEGVENEGQAKAIRDMGADVLQGYYYGKPLTVFNFENKYFK